MRKLLLAVAALASALLASPATQAQLPQGTWNLWNPACNSGAGGVVGSGTCQLPTSGGGGGGSVSPFSATGTGTTLSATTSTSQVALPGSTSDTNIVVFNPPSSTGNAHIKLGTSAGVTAATTDTVVPPGAVANFPRSSTSITNIAAIMDAGAATLQVWSGTGGQYAGFGGGGGGGGGGGVVTQATASNLNAQVVGNVPAGSADSGNGVKVSGVYNSTLPTYTSGNRTDAQFSVKGGLYVTLLSTGGAMANIASPSDAAGANSALFTISYGANWNGSTWDRNYSANAANNTSGTGVPAAGNMVWTGSNWLRQAGDTNGYAQVNAPITPNLVNPSVTYNIAATAGGTAYGAGQLICSSTVAATCTSGLPSFSLALSGGRITGYRMQISDPTTTAWPLNATITIKEWSARPTLAAGDHATYALTSGTANWIGDFQCTSNGQEGDGSTWYCTPIGPVPELKGVSNVYVALVATSGSGVIVTNTAETATLTPTIEQ